MKIIPYLLFFLLQSPVLYAESASGLLVTHGDERGIFDFELATLINEHFEDGDKGNGTVTSNIQMYFTQCYGGDFLENFNDSTEDGGDILDGVKFTNTVSVTAQEQGDTSYYGGFHVGASQALKPGSTAVDVAIAGMRDRDAREFPQFRGRNSTIGGATSTHVLVWAGDPNAQDLQDIDNLVNNFSGTANLTMTVLSGDGTRVSGASSDGPATMAGLRQALAEIGALMDDGADEQFIMFVTDHGSILVDKKETVTVEPGAIESISTTLGIAYDFWFGGSDQPTVSVTAPVPVAEEVKPQVEVVLNGNTLGTLDQAVESESVTDDKIDYTFTITDATYLQYDVSLQEITINNQSSISLDFDKVSFLSGDINKQLLGDTPSDDGAILDLNILSRPFGASIDISSLPAFPDFAIGATIPSDPPPAGAVAWQVVNTSIGHIDGPFALPGAPNPHGLTVLDPFGLGYAPGDACLFEHVHGDFMGHADPDNPSCGHGVLDYILSSAPPIFEAGPFPPDTILPIETGQLFTFPIQVCADTQCDMTVDATFNWTPTTGQDGIHDVLFVSHNDIGQISEQPLQLQVFPPCSSTGCSNVTLTPELGIDLPSMDVFGTVFDVQLSFTPNPADPAGFYWTLGNASPGAAIDDSRIILQENLDIVLFPIDVSGTFFDVRLEFVPDPERLLWKLGEVKAR